MEALFYSHELIRFINNNLCGHPNSHQNHCFGVRFFLPLVTCHQHLFHQVCDII